MAVISVDPLWENYVLSDSLESGYTGSRSFRVITDDPAEQPYNIITASGIPLLGDNFPGSSNCRLVERRPTRTAASRLEWIVLCDYRTKLSKEEKDRFAQASPLDRAATITIDSVRSMKQFRRLLRTDYYSTWASGSFSMQSCLNSASDPFEPVLEYPGTDWIITVTKNVSTIPSWLFTYADSVNDADQNFTYLGNSYTIPKGCGQIVKLTMPPDRQDNGIDYAPFSFQIAIRTPRDAASGESSVPEPWDDEILDQGMRVIGYSESGGTIDQIWQNVLDRNGMGLTLPVPFNGEGNPIRTDGAAIEESALKWSCVRPFKRKDFSVLPWT